MNNLKIDVMELKVGYTAEVIEITNSSYLVLYKNGAWGTIDSESSFGGCLATVGSTVEGYGGLWHVPNGTYRKVGKLTVKALKYG